MRHWHWCWIWLRAYGVIFGAFIPRAYGVMRAYPDASEWRCFISTRLL